MIASMTSQEEPLATDEYPDLEAQVVRHLLSDRGFFERHPQLLLRLEIPHPTGGAISLIEHQVRLLRKQLETERQRLNHLISRAREYEALSIRLHHLVLKLIAVSDSRQLCTLLQETLLSELSAEAMTLKLLAAEPAGDDPEDPETALALAFRDFIDRHHTCCGPLDTAKARMLFGDTGELIRSAALVPLQAEGHAGILAIGSRDPDRFGPDMGTELLDRLGEVISQKLHVIPLAQCDGMTPRGSSPEHG
jgi:hypothetical protein